MTGMGAAVSLTDATARSVRIDNRIPLKARIRKKIHTLPLVLIALLLLGMGTEYAFMKNRHGGLKASIAALNSRMNMLQAKVNDEEAQKRRFNQLRDRQKEIEEKIQMLDKTLPERNVHLAELFKELIDNTPPDAVLGGHHPVQRRGLLYQREQPQGSVHLPVRREPEPAPPGPFLPPRKEHPAGSITEIRKGLRAVGARTGRSGPLRFQHPDPAGGVSAMRRMKKTEQILVVVAVAVISGFFFMREFHDPLTREIKTLRTEQHQIQSQVRDLESRPLSTDRIRESIQKILPKIEEIEAAFQETAQRRLTPLEKIEETVMDINETATNNGLTVRVLTPLDEGRLKLYPSAMREKTLFDRHCYEMNLTGNFLDLYSFVQEIGSMEKLVTLTRLSVRGDGSRGIVDVNLVLLI